MVKNNFRFVLILLPALVLLINAGCTKTNETIITITVKDKAGNPLSDRKVYEFEYPATHELGNNPFVANKFRLSDKSGKAVFVLEDYEYDITKTENTLWFTVFNEVAGDTYTVAGTVEVTFGHGEKITQSLYVD